MTLATFSTLASYARVRCFPYLIRNRASLEAWQARRLQKWLVRDVPKVAAFREYAGKAVQLNQLPIMEKSDLMADFSRYNTSCITNDQGWQAFEGAKRLGRLIVGASTGTSGNRGLFVISQRERFAWLGAILAKALPDFWRHRDRIAVLLPLDTPLYDSANKATNLRLEFFDINQPLESILPALEAFNPTVLIAPPRILRRLCELEINLSPRLFFSAAEKLEEFDKLAVRHAFNVSLKEIYMATEGLLGVTCSRNRLHLSEDCMHFEFEKAGDNLVSPIISDFSRTTQIMARYRLNDLLRLDTEPCPCGSPLVVAEEVVGRQDDAFSFMGIDGRQIQLTPDILRNVIVDTDRSIVDFRLAQTGPLHMELQLPDECSAEVRQTARDRIATLLVGHDVVPDVQIALAKLVPHTKGKLRRVERRWFP